MRFKLVETGKSYAEAGDSVSVAEKQSGADIPHTFTLPVTLDAGRISDDEYPPVEVNEDPAVSQRISAEGFRATSCKGLFSEVVNWVDSHAIRWQQLHKALLRIYEPAWDRIDGRDVLVSWVAANLALCRARHELERLSNRHSLSLRERDSRNAREADISFWGRVSSRMEAKVPEALATDSKAVEILTAVMSRGSKSNQVPYGLVESESDTHHGRCTSEPSGGIEDGAE